MVNRCKTVEETPCTVVDLDGTYIKGNTLKIYLKCGIRYFIENNKYRDLCKVLVGVGKRKLRLLTHLEMKNIIMRTLYPYNENLTGIFVNYVTGRINSKVNSFIDGRKAQGHCILLATAAPDLYVQAIWDGFFVATVYCVESQGCLAECRGIEKLKRVRKWLADNNCKLDTIITDHKDDFPLLEANRNGTNILVNPSQTTIRYLNSMSTVKYKIL